MHTNGWMVKRSTEQLGGEEFPLGEINSKSGHSLPCWLKQNQKGYHPGEQHLAREILNILMLLFLGSHLK